MSGWDAYIDSIRSNIVGSNAVAVALVGQDSSIWAKDASFDISADEILKIKAAVIDGDSSIYAGFTLGGEKFACTRVDSEDKVLQGKGKGGAFGKGFVGIQGTGSALLIAIGDDTAQPGSVMVGLNAVAQYLEGSGY